MISDGCFKHSQHLCIMLLHLPVIIIVFLKHIIRNDDNSDGGKIIVYDSLHRTQSLTQ